MAGIETKIDNVEGKIDKMHDGGCCDEIRISNLKRRIEYLEAENKRVVLSRDQIEYQMRMQTHENNKRDEKINDQAAIIQAQATKIEALNEENKKLQEQCCLITAINKVAYMAEQFELSMGTGGNKRARTTE